MSRKIISLLNTIYRDFAANQLPDASTAQALKDELDELVRSVGARKPDLANKINHARTLRSVDDVYALSALVNEAQLKK
jgi:hypothetical protein